MHPEPSPFDEWERELHGLPVDPAPGAKRRRGGGRSTKGRKFHPQPLTTTEVRTLLCACRTYKPRGLRDQALVVLLWRGMLRINEALHLKVSDLDMATGELRVLVAKGGKARTVALDPAAVEIVARWLEARAKLPGLMGSAGEGWLLCTVNGYGRKPPGRLLSTADMRRIVARLGKRAGLEKRVHPHGLRHSGACELRKAGVDIGVISKALGHASIATTARYLDHIAPADVTAAMRGLKW